MCDCACTIFRAMIFVIPGTGFVVSVCASKALEEFFFYFGCCFGWAYFSLVRANSLLWTSAAKNAFLNFDQSSKESSSGRQVYLQLLKMGYSFGSKKRIGMKLIKYILILSALHKKICVWDRVIFLSWFPVNFSVNVWEKRNITVNLALCYDPRTPTASRINCVCDLCVSPTHKNPHWFSTWARSTLIWFSEPRSCSFHVIIVNCTH